MPIQFRYWAKWSLTNLVILAAVGVLLRYKIVFPLPMVDQKNLLHGHSHFAFSGWVSMALFTSLITLLSNYYTVSIRKYHRLFLLGQVANFGMLFSFPFGGYTPVSICFSTLSVIFSYLFAILFIADMNRSSLPKHIQLWLKAALFFYAFSSLGAFNLAYLMATHTATQEWYIGSVYFFLHFQYNGWFFFALVGLLLQQLIMWKISLPDRWHSITFYCFFLSCFPSFFLSALWMKLPTWVYGLAIVSVISEWVSYGLLIYIFLKSIRTIRQQANPFSRILWIAGSLAFTIKLILQTLSLSPSLSYLAFGFRPIVIGYLHLVLLGMVSLTLIGYLIQQSLLTACNSISQKGILIFLGGVLLNEIFLMQQGVFAIRDIYTNSLNYLLFFTALILLSGAVCFRVGQKTSPSLSNSI